jgi:hypothetical protein
MHYRHAVSRASDISHFLKSLSKFDDILKGAEDPY